MPLPSDRVLNNKATSQIVETTREVNGALVGSLDRTSGALEMFVGGCFGAGGGYLLDRQFDSLPAFSVILAIAGFLASALSLYRRSKAEFAQHALEREIKAGRVTQ